METPESRAEHLTGALTAVGFEPRLTDRGDHLSVEADLGDAASPETWHSLVKWLDTADWFGLVDSSANGRTLWAAFAREASAAARPAAAEAKPSALGS